MSRSGGADGVHDPVLNPVGDGRAQIAVVIPRSYVCVHRCSDAMSSPDEQPGEHEQLC